MAELTDQIAIVTGASRGIGKSIALSLADAGAKVIACARDEGRLATVMAEAKDAGAAGEVGARAPGRG